MLGWQLYCHPGATEQLSPQLVHKISLGGRLVTWLLFNLEFGICILKFAMICII